MANINNQGRWVSGQKSSKKHSRVTDSAPPAKRARPGRTALTQPDENGLKLGDEVVQPGDAGSGVIVDIRTIDDEKTYGVRSPGGKTSYYGASEFGA